MIITRRWFVLGLTLYTALFVTIVILRSLQVRSDAHLGRLVFTDYPKPKYDFNVNLIDLERSGRTSLVREDYGDMGFLFPIDDRYVYGSMCFARNNPIFCSASVHMIIAPKDSHRFEDVKAFWKANYGSPVWSPDGTHIAFSVAAVGAQSAALSSGDTYVMNADGTNITDLLPTENINGFDFAWSPDSRQIAFACGNALYLCISRVDGSQLQKLEMPQYTKVRDMDWSPDGSQIVLSLSATDYQNAELYLMNADGSNLHRLLEAGANGFGQPKWSPDGSKIIFQSSGRDHADLYVINPDGTNLRHLTRGLNANSFGAVWSPDSRNIAFFSGLANRNLFIFIADVSRGAIQKITKNSTWQLYDASPRELFWLP